MPEKGNNDILITRVYDFPRELVFRAWTDPELLSRWYAPDGCTVEFFDFDFREGGTFRSCIRNPAHHDCLCISQFVEITVPERLAYTLSFADRQGNRIEPAAAGADLDWPRQTVVTITFAETAGKTTVTLHQTVDATLAIRTGAYPSWLRMLDRLSTELAKEYQ
ncbi:MAG: SRPBCC domain-containing protein [Acidobacteria bacterium]|nr:SRPBCC domain-containing protein [Acidobacteriota bacterium]